MGEDTSYYLRVARRTARARDRGATISYLRALDMVKADPEAASIWRYLAAPHTVCEVVDRLVSELGIEPDAALEDVRLLLARMLSHGLVSTAARPCTLPAAPTLGRERED